MSALPPKWMLYVALVLVCQTARRAEGYPRAASVAAAPSPTAGSSSTPRPQDASSVSKLIETAYKNGELLRREQWSRPINNNPIVGSIAQLDPSNGTSDVSRYEKRKLLQASSADVQSDANEKIFFPTDGWVSSTPSVCQMNTFCENVIDYPKQLVNAAIARNASLRFLQSVDPVGIEDRMNTDESPLCRYREQVVYPQTAQNKEKQWLFVVNQDNLKQGIRIEVCMNDGQECNMIQGFAEGYTTSCKQKFIYRELAAVNSDGKIFKDQFRFPSSCCCHVKFIGNPNVRVGLGLDPEANHTTVATKTRRRK